MNRINVLDCTLRDGGYCNEWRFGRDNTKKIVDGLVEANVEIIECGFITNRVQYDNNVTKYTKIEQVSEFIPKDKDIDMTKDENRLLAEMIRKEVKFLRN